MFGAKLVTRGRLALLLAAALLAAIPVVTLSADKTPVVISTTTTRIEQDWEIVVKDPDPSSFSPQVALWLKPDPQIDYGMLVTFNYQDTPAYAGGGIHIQAWDGETLLGAKSYKTGFCPGKGEKIPVTAFVEVKAGKFSCGVSGGTSASFGDLSKAGLSVTGVPTTLTRLSAYQTQDSIDNTLFLVGPARLSSINILAVRGYDANGKQTFLEGSSSIPIEVK
jgi:hypothetical protein